MGKKDSRTDVERRSDEILAALDNMRPQMQQLLVDKSLANASGRFGVYFILDKGDLRGIRITSEATILN